jgi:hypothetical protein
VYHLFRSKRYAPKNANIIQPEKKPKGKELTDEQKAQNKAKSKLRVVVEHSSLHNFRLRARGKIIL